MVVAVAATARMPVSVNAATVIISATDAASTIGGGRLLNGEK